jgi:hypothetical protein
MVSRAFEFLARVLADLTRENAFRPGKGKLRSAPGMLSKP